MRIGNVRTDQVVGNTLVVGGPRIHCTFFRFQVGNVRSIIFFKILIKPLMFPFTTSQALYFQDGLKLALKHTRVALQDAVPTRVPPIVAPTVACTRPFRA